MLPSVAPRAAFHNVEIPGLCSAHAGELPGQLGARTDVELAIDVRQRRLDGAVGDDEDRRNLLVRLALGDEHGDPPLARRELTRGRHAAADPRQLVTHARRPDCRTELFELAQCALEYLARLAASSQPPQE